MEKTTFTEEEITKIKQLQEKYQVLGIQVVQLTLAKKSAQEYVQSLEDQNNQLTNQIVEVNIEEKEFAKTLSDKYGIGSLDLESGVFTSNT